MQVINFVTNDKNCIWREYITDGVVSINGYAAGNNHRDNPKRWTMGSSAQDVERLESILAISGIAYVKIGICDIEVWLHQENADWTSVDSELRRIVNGW